MLSIGRAPVRASSPIRAFRGYAVAAGSGSEPRALRPHASSRSSATRRTPARTASRSRPPAPPPSRLRSRTSAPKIRANRREDRRSRGRFSSSWRWPEQLACLAPTTATSDFDAPLSRPNTTPSGVPPEAWHVQCKPNIAKKAAMQLPLRLTFRGFLSSLGLEARVGPGWRNGTSQTPGFGHARRRAIFQGMSG